MNAFLWRLNYVSTVVGRSVQKNSLTMCSTPKTCVCPPSACVHRELNETDVGVAIVTCLGPVLSYPLPRAMQAKKKKVDVLSAADMGVDLKPRNTVIEVRTLFEITTFK